MRTSSSFLFSRVVNFVCFTTMLKSLTLIAVLFLGTIASVPTNFDSRSHWNCKENILNQGSCNCCWAFCSVESFSDRSCISGEAPSGTTISPEPILDCSGKGCNTAIPATAWGYLINHGSASCTNACTSGCAPYDAGHGQVNKCHQGKCDSGSNYPKTYIAGSFKGLPQKQVSTYQNEIYKNGPIEACFTIYSNFSPFFKSDPTGIYTEASGSEVGGHCVKMLGWGVSGGINYWLLANSWGTSFADKGYFKMESGKNLCNVEGQVSVGYTKHQSLAEGIPLGTIEYNRSWEPVGNWVEQEVDADFVVEAAKWALPLAGEKLHREFVFESVVSARTKVVEGYWFEILVSTVDGPNLELEIWQLPNLEYKLEGSSLFF